MVILLLYGSGYDNIAIEEYDTHDRMFIIIMSIIPMLQLYRHEKSINLLQTTYMDVERFMDKDI